MTSLTATMSDMQNIPDELFEPQSSRNVASEVISRPTLGYWQDAMLRLRKDKVALACLAIIIAVSAIGIFAPLLFPSSVDGVPYENQQNSNAIDQSPNLGQKMIVVEDNPTFSDGELDASYKIDGALIAAESLTPPAQLNIEGAPSVNGVALRWTSVAGVSGYQIYRTTIPQNFNDLDALKSGQMGRGLLVTEITNPAQITFMDSMGLDSEERYAYTIVSVLTNPETMSQQLSEQAAVAVAPLRRTIKLTDALAIDRHAEIGKEIKGRMQLFGTDALGRDTLARMIVGTRVDMMLALLVPFLSIVIGLIYGSISGLMGKKVDTFMMRIVEVIDNFPDLLFFILLQVAIGKGITSLFIAMSAFAWAGFARIVRGEVLRLREIEFVHASRLLGAPMMRLVLKHIGPNLLGITIIAWSARIPAVIAFETFLSLLGLGLEQPTPSWGNVVFDAARRLQVNPIQFFLPSAVLAISLLAFYLLGDSLRDAFDPKLRGRT